MIFKPSLHILITEIFKINTLIIYSKLINTVISSKYQVVLVHAHVNEKLFESKYFHTVSIFCRCRKILSSLGSINCEMLNQ